MRACRAVVVVAVLAMVVAGCAASGGGVDGQSKKAAEANTQLGIELLRNNEPQRALKKLNKAVRQDPNSSNAYMVRALAFERLDKPAEAEASFEEALSLDAENPQAMNNYGSFLCQRGDVDQAVKLFERSADIPTYETPEVPLTNAGMCTLRQGKRERAEEFLRKALQQNDEQPAALLRMAQIRLKNEQYMSARGYYQRYLSVARQSALSAWLGVRIESALGERGDKDAIASYEQLLRNKFPDSEQTDQLLEWESNGRL